MAIKYAPPYSLKLQFYVIIPHSHSPPNRSIEFILSSSSTHSPPPFFTDGPPSVNHSHPPRLPPLITYTHRLPPFILPLLNTPIHHTSLHYTTETLIFSHNRLPPSIASLLQSHRNPPSFIRLPPSISPKPYICGFAMPGTPDSCPCFSSVDLVDLVVPDTPEHLWPSNNPIVRRFHVGTFTDTVVPETELDIIDPSSIFEYFGSEGPYYGPPPLATPYYGPPPPATSVNIPEAPHRLF